jgi:hypothetical protein
MSEERTTQREIAQDKMNGEIMLTLGRLEGQMSGVKESIDRTLEKFDDHETRISANEKALYNVKLKIGLIGAAIGAVFSFLSDWVWRKLTGH